MRRVYEATLEEHFGRYRQMVFLTGPRQVGKTTIARAAASGGPYLDWDDQDDREVILRGPRAVAERCGLLELAEKPPVVVFDELHKYRKWKSFLKGFGDTWGDRARTIVTGSARLNVYRRGGDSLMGRYFPYRVHPVSVAETVRVKPVDKEVGPPCRPSEHALADLLRFGGFPEPWLRAETRFANRWRALRREQFVREDLRDLTRVAEVDQLAVLVELLIRQAGSLVNMSSLAREVNVSVDTVKRWLRILESLFVVFTVRPWHRNVRKSLRKQPKVYSWDWSSVPEDGPRFENLVASHLLKAVHWWTDRGLGTYELHFLRDFNGREVDFLVTRDDRPFFIVEAKSADRNLHAPLAAFAEMTGVSHAFQVVRDSPYVDRDCFEASGPLIVPAATFLSQLV